MPAPGLTRGLDETEGPMDRGPGFRPATGGDGGDGAPSPHRSAGATARRHFRRVVALPGSPSAQAPYSRCPDFFALVAR